MNNDFYFAEIRGFGNLSEDDGRDAISAALLAIAKHADRLGLDGAALLASAADAASKVGVEYAYDRTVEIGIDDAIRSAARAQRERDDAIRKLRRRFATSNAARVERNDPTWGVLDARAVEVDGEIVVAYSEDGFEPVEQRFESVEAIVAAGWYARGVR